MMGLRESILEENIIRKRPCVVCETIKILDKADAAELVDCLDTTRSAVVRSAGRFMRAAIRCIRTVSKSGGIVRNATRDASR